MNCGFWPQNAQRASNRSKSRFWDATEFYIEHLERMRGSVPVTVLFADYLETKQRAKLSVKHLADIKQRTGALRCRLFRQSDQDSHSPGDRRLAAWTRSFPSNGQ